MKLNSAHGLKPENWYFYQEVVYESWQNIAKRQCVVGGCGELGKYMFKAKREPFRYNSTVVPRTIVICQKCSRYLKKNLEIQIPGRY